MNEKNTNKVKKSYKTPKIERLGKLSTLIQGASGQRRDAFPQDGTRP